MTNVCKPAPTAHEKRLQAIAMGAHKRGATFGPGRYSGHEEPLLNEIIEDPMTRRLMDSDGVAYDHLMSVISAARIKLRR